MDLRIENINLEQEAIELVALKKLNLKDYIVVDQSFEASGNLAQQSAHIFRFPDAVVEKGAKIALFVAAKKKASSLEDYFLNTLYQQVFFWGLEEEILDDQGDTVFLYKLEKVDAKYQEKV